MLTTKDISSELPTVLNEFFRLPMPGDFVQVNESKYTDVPTGSLGVILGNSNNFKTEYDICFNPVPCPWLTNTHTSSLITAAGGCMLPLVDAELLMQSNLLVEKEFYSPSKAISKIRCNVKVWYIDLRSYERAGKLNAFIHNSKN